MAAVGSRVAIVPATLLDLTYIAANMRVDDWREIACQFPPDTPPVAVAAIALSMSSWVARLDGQPVATVGYGPVNAATVSLWAWGTKRMTRAVPAITRFVRDVVAPEWLAAGINRVEARSIVGHDAAHRWLAGQGFEAVPCPCFGRGGEDFLLFSVTRVSWARRGADSRARAAIEGVDA